MWLWYLWPFIFSVVVNSKVAKILILGATFSPIGETYKENPDRNSKQDTIEKMPEKMGSNKAEFTSNYIDTSKKDRYW